MKRTTNLLVFGMLLICSASIRRALADVCSVPAFANARTSDAGGTVSGWNGAAATGDFNGDGKLDLAVPAFKTVDGSADGHISVLLGDGLGNLTSSFLAATGANPRFVATGDFNGDGKSDLVVAFQGKNGGVSILLGDGNGHFLQAHNYLGVPALCVAVADFNADGKADLAVCLGDFQMNHGVDNNIAVLLGNGDGTFQEATSYRAGYTPSVVVGDFDRDGHLDLAVEADAADGTDRATIAIFLGKGDGTFRPAVNNYLTGPQWIWNGSLTAGDLNHDGITDLVALDTSFEFPQQPGSYGYGYYGNIWVLLGKGDGTFQQPVRYIAGGLPVFAAICDLNGDDVPDLAVEDLLLDGGFSMLLGNGDGTFQSSTPGLPGAGEASLLAVGDFNGDGKPDLAAIEHRNDGGSSTNVVSVLLNLGASPSPVPAFLEVGRVFVASFLVGDFNGDGRADLASIEPTVLPGSVPPTLTGSSIAVDLGNGDGTFQFGTSRGAPTVFRSAATGDFNGDGKLDIVVSSSASDSCDADSGRMSVLLGDGSGGFAAAIQSEIPSCPSLFKVGEVNGDGKSDVVLLDNGVYDPTRDAYTNRIVMVLLSKGDGTFQLPVKSDGEVGADFFGLADLNGDGKLDVVSASSVLFGKGDGTFAAAVKYDADPNWFLAEVADINNDGKLDLITYGSVLLGNGDGSFQAPLSFSGGTNTDSVAVGDFNGDGRPDLIAGGMFLFLGQGDGTFQAPLSYAGSGLLWPGAVADFNGDGKSDFVVRHTTTILLYALVWISTSCSAGPSLAIARNADSVTVSWTSAPTGFALESSPSLNQASWKPIGTVPTNRNGRWEATIPTTASQDYFRLYRASVGQF